MACYLFLYQRSTATAFDRLSYSYRTSIAKYFDLVVTIEIYIYWPNIVSFSAHTCAGIVHPNRVKAAGRSLSSRPWRLWPRSPLLLAAQFTRVRLSSAACLPKIGFCACAGTPPTQERRSWPKPNSYAKTRLQLGY